MTSYLPKRLNVKKSKLFANLELENYQAENYEADNVQTIATRKLTIGFSGFNSLAFEFISLGDYSISERRSKHCPFKSSIKTKATLKRNFSKTATSPEQINKFLSIRLFPRRLLGATADKAKLDELLANKPKANKKRSIFSRSVYALRYMRSYATRYMRSYMLSDAIIERFKNKSSNLFIHCEKI